MTHTLSETSFTLPTFDFALGPPGDLPGDSAGEPSEGWVLREANSPSQWNTDVTLQAWKRFLDASNNPNAMYQSPEWLTHLARSSELRERLRVLIIQTQSGRIVGLLPLLKNALVLDISVAGRTLLRNRVLVESLLGYEPLSAGDAGVMSFIARHIVQEAEHAIHLRMLSQDSSFHQELVKATAESKRAQLYDFTETRCRHLINLPSDFPTYLSKFTTKKRYNLKRQIQQLRDASGGELRLQEFNRIDDIERFLRDATPVASACWQRRVSDDVISNSARWQEELSAIAAMGMLRAFILYKGDQACAFVLGIQHKSIFHFDATGYDPQLHAWSPGTAILYLLIEHLIREPKGAQRISLGFGDQEYKRVFGNESMPTVELLVYRQTVATTARIGLHRAYRSGVRAARNRRHGSE